MLTFLSPGAAMSAELKSGLGHFDGKTHVLPLRVYYEDTDLSGVVYHANYLRYMERPAPNSSAWRASRRWPTWTAPNPPPGRSARSM